MTKEETMTTHCLPKDAEIQLIHMTFHQNNLLLHPDLSVSLSGMEEQDYDKWTFLWEGVISTSLLYPVGQDMMMFSGPFNQVPGHHRGPSWQFALASLCCGTVFGLIHMLSRMLLCIQWWHYIFEEIA